MEATIVKVTDIKALWSNIIKFSDEFKRFDDGTVTWRIGNEWFIARETNENGWAS